jgi:hypothetical protein
MSAYQNIIAGVLAAAAIASANAGVAQTVQESQAAVGLARAIGEEASKAETGPTGAAIEAAVVAALKGLIIRSAAEPRVVLAALDDVLAACRPVSGRPAQGWSCPGTASAYVGIASLRSIVVADLSQRNVGALGGAGTAPLDVIRSAPASAGYQSF